LSLEIIYQNRRLTKLPHKIRKARLDDVPAIYELLKHKAGQGLLLPRSLANLYEMVQTLWVGEDESGRVAGAAALQVAWENLGEVRSLAVREDWAGRGLGRALTRAVEAEAAALGVGRLFVLTYVPDFFTALGFTVIPLADLPQKIWADCFQCVHFPDCQETAMIKYLPAASGAASP
jgi:amino-acid N-acetyltransferase